MNSQNAIIANNYDCRVHQAYFVASLRTRFPQLTFTEDKEASVNKDTTVLKTNSPSTDFSTIKITLFKDDIELQISGLHFIKRFNPAMIPVTAAPDADPRIPLRLQALDFIQQIIEDKFFFRCYRYKGKIIRIEIVSVISDTVKETKTYSVRGSFVKFSTRCEITDYHWSGLKTTMASS